MNNKIKNTIITLLIFGILLALVIYAFKTSDFSNLDKVRDGMDTKLKAKIAKKRYYNTDVKVKDNGLLNLGDFEINIGHGQKLITNISAKYHKPDGWGMSTGIDNELLSKGSIIRNAVIEAIMNKKESDVRSYRVKTEIIDNINSTLSSTRVEKIYFNKLIISE